MHPCSVPQSAFEFRIAIRVRNLTNIAGIRARIDRQVDRETGRQVDRQTDRQTDRGIESIGILTAIGEPLADMFGRKFEYRRRYWFSTESTDT